jgi:hypothetical protein
MRTPIALSHVVRLFPNLSMVDVNILVEWVGKMLSALNIASVISPATLIVNQKTATNL